MKQVPLWIPFCVVLIGIPFGSGVYTFIYAEGLSYLSNDPTACANCHSMRDTYDGWAKSPHSKNATCNDCHVPKSFVGKWYTKAENGLFHSIAMTLNNYDSIRARPASKAIALKNCVRCHEDTVHHFQSGYKKEDQLDCTHCHRSIGHPHS